MPEETPKPMTLAEVLDQRTAAHRTAREIAQRRLAALQEQGAAMARQIYAIEGAIQELETLRKAILPAPNPVEKTA